MVTSFVRIITSFFYLKSAHVENIQICFTVVSLIRLNQLHNEM